MDTPRERPDRFDRFSSTVARITGQAGAFTRGRIDRNGSWKRCTSRSRKTGGDGDE
jgi:hypothetical protein